jgi:holo-[acyl-carrier protein] synthase
VIVGIGIDLVEVERVRDLLERRGARAVARLFTEGEAAYAAACADPAPRFAARLAAKEAAYKALSGNALARGIGWRELEVVSVGEGRAPELRLHGATERRAAELGVSRAWLTLTHERATAAAMVVLEGDAPDPLVAPLPPRLA